MKKKISFEFNFIRYWIPKQQLPYIRSFSRRTHKNGRKYFARIATFSPHWGDAFRQTSEKAQHTKWPNEKFCRSFIVVNHLFKEQRLARRSRLATAKTMLNVNKHYVGCVCCVVLPNANPTFWQSQTWAKSKLLSPTGTIIYLVL